MIETIVFDVGETLTKDDRYWTSWANWLKVPSHTLSVLVGAVVAQGRDGKDALKLVSPDMDVESAERAREGAGRGEHIGEADLYPDVRPALGALHKLGIRVVIAGNGTARAAELLRDLDLPADAVATSGEWGVAKPDPAFFAKVLEVSQAGPAETLYVGDHPAHDIFPARQAGLRTAHLRRGPWGHLWANDPAVAEAADCQLDSLTVLAAMISQRAAAVRA
ncbi:HAD family hydrolase [Streptomyces alfalfae]|uniref:Hydrolase n=1 Tax=Streptomyces alfalfae TaxID=1642299 RepID=A0A1P8TP99_9ACTN|nr:MULTISPECIES: HAD family hydrolase [Streptomyces]AYA19910.1 HAD family hydrolase [Streptomyces fradiae]APY89476.1 hydrolase [Streptomyces alfalfae]KUL61858.1 hydrolase [Streptomyces sp. NRRL S-1521]QQC88093.1 HAD family hydrolase [Streptomyces alfalfae]QUI30493.1 HAD family hydrolase [Streptomyces alfalfae]